MLKKIFQLSSHALGGNLSPYLAWEHVYEPQLRKELTRLEYTKTHEVFYVFENAKYYQGIKIPNQIDSLSKDFCSAVSLRNVENRHLEIEYGSHIQLNRSVTDEKLQIFILAKKLWMYSFLPSHRIIHDLSQKAKEERKSLKLDIDKHALAWDYAAKIFNPSLDCAHAEKILQLMFDNSWRKFFESYFNKVPPISTENINSAYKYLVHGGEIKVTSARLYCE